MRIKLVLILLPVLLVVSCSSTKYTEYQGGKIIEGQGGAMKAVNGIDIWTDGSPNRKFKVIGVLDDEYGDGHGLVGAVLSATRSSIDSKLATAAKTHGGDAVVIVRQDQILSGFDVKGSGTVKDNGNGYGTVHYNGKGEAMYDHSTKAYVIKYVVADN
jgi:hypothetical protein